MGKQKRGQLTIFIMVGVVVILLVSSYFLLFSENAPFKVFQQDVENPNDYITECLRTEIDEEVETFLENNLYPEELSSNFFLYNNDGVSEKIPLLCTVGEFYTSCVNQDPNLKSRIKRDMIMAFQPLADECFSDLVSAYERQGYSVSLTRGNISLNNGLEGFDLEMEHMLSVENEGVTETYDDFEVSISSRIFRLAETTKDIVNIESALCEFDYMHWMMNDQSVFITRFRAGDQTKVYTLKDRLTNEEIKFAIRTCLIPAGI